MIERDQQSMDQVFKSWSRLDEEEAEFGDDDKKRVSGWEAANYLTLDRKFSITNLQDFGWVFSCLQANGAS